MDTEHLFNQFIESLLEPERVKESDIKKCFWRILIAEETSKFFTPCLNGQLLGSWIKAEIPARVYAYMLNPKIALKVEQLKPIALKPQRIGR